MKKKNAWYFLAIVLGAWLPMASRGQTPVSEIVAQGASRMGPADVRALLTGSSVTVVQEDGISWQQFIYKPDGVIGGSFKARGPNLLYGRSGGIDGNWDVQEDGRTCSEFHWYIRMNRKDAKQCGYWYVLGERHFFVTRTPSHPEPAAYEREIKH